MPVVDGPTAVEAAGRVCGEESSCCGGSAALEGAVDRRAAAPEQVGDLGCAARRRSSWPDELFVVR
jgi:hypothetical protein